MGRCVELTCLKGNGSICTAAVRAQDSRAGQGAASLAWNVLLPKEQAVFLLLRRKLCGSDTGRQNAFLPLSELVKASL